MKVYHLDGTRWALARALAAAPSAIKYRIESSKQGQFYEIEVDSAPIGITAVAGSFHIAYDVKVER